MEIATANIAPIAARNNETVGNCSGVTIKLNIIPKIPIIKIQVEITCGI